MIKGKKQIGFLLLLFAACFAAWAFLTFNTASAAVGADIVIEDDFTKTSFIDGQSDINNSGAYEYSGVSCAKGFAEEGFGLIPCENFAHTFFRPDDGYIIYKVQADDGMKLKSAKIDLTSYVSHCSNAAYIGENKTNVKVYVATDSTAFTQVFSHIPKEEYLGLAGGSAERINNAKNNVIDMSDYVSGATVAYVKIELLHPSYQDLSSWISESDQYRSYFVDDDHQWVKRLGVSVLKVKIIASQTAEGAIYAKVGFTDDYTTTKVSDSVNVQDYNNLLSYPDAHGALPTATWDAYCKTGDAYVIYKISAKSGSTLKSVKATLNFDLTSSGGLYNWWEGNMDNANAYLDVSMDGGTTWNTELDVLNEPTLQVRCTDGNTYNPFKASNFNSDGTSVSSPIGSYHSASPQVDLSEYSGQEIYLRVRIKHPAPVDVNETFGPSGNNGVPMGRVAVYYKGITVSADQETVSAPVQKEDKTGNLLIADDFRVMEQGFSLWKTKRQAVGVSTKAYGSVEHGLIPAEQWGETVNAGNGHMIYQLPLNGNGITTNLNSLKLNLGINFNGKVYNGKVIVKHSFDGTNYSKTQEYISVSGQETLTNGTVDFGTIILSEQAKTAKTLFVKIEIEHDTANSVALNDIAVKINSIQFVGFYNFVMESGAGIRFNKDGNGLTFTALVRKDFVNMLSAAGYKTTFGTVIMPAEYIKTYGDINYENLFGENPVYCWGKVAEGKITVLNGTALLDSDYNEYYHSFNYSIVNLLKENLDKKFVARSYIKCDKDGQTTFIFADYADSDIKNNERSVISVAQKLNTKNVEELETIKKEYLEKAKGLSVNYTVKHVYVLGNEIVETTTQTKTAKAGTVISAERRSKTGYTAVEEISINVGSEEKEYKSFVSGTVLADGSLEFTCYYVKNA